MKIQINHWILCARIRTYVCMYMCVYIYIFCSCLQIQRSGFDSRHYQIFWEVGLERGPLSLVSTTEELLERKSSGFSLENQDYECRDPLCWPRGTPLSAKVGTNLADKRSVQFAPRLKPQLFIYYIASINSLWRGVWLGSHLFPTHHSFYCTLQSSGAQSFTPHTKLSH
jgi:hypothetical protein